MELKAQHQNIQALTDGHTYMVIINSLCWHLWCEGQVERLKLLNASNLKSTVSGKHYAASYSLEQSNTPDKAQITS